MAALRERLQKLAEVIDVGGGRNTTSASSPESIPEINERTSETRGDRKLELESMLSDLYRGDAAAFLLFTRLSMSMRLPHFFPGMRLLVTSVQKKGNILYIQEQWQFNETNIPETAGHGTWLVDRESFVITSPQTIFLVLTEVPSIDGRSEAFAWISEWLAGLRIPLDVRTQ